MKLEKQERLQTGIDILDRKLGGGIPTGTVTAVSAGAGSQSELFLYELAATRETVYLSTIRTEEAVEMVLESRGIDSSSVDVLRVDEGDPLGDAQRILADLPDGVNVIVDPVDVLESSEDTSYRWFLSELNECVTGTTNVAFLHCLDDEPTPDHRRGTLHLSDLVLRISTELKGDSIVNQMTVPKFRTGQSISEVIKLDVTSEIEVDMSRNLL